MGSPLNQIYERHPPLSMLLAGERLDDLQYKGLFIIQHPQKFCFGTDAVLLSAFTALKKKDYVADLGTGTGILPLLLSAKMQDTRFVGVELQADMADMARRSVAYNNLSHRISVWQGDMRDFPVSFGKNIFTAVVMNPPYQKAGAGLSGKAEAQRLAREETATLGEMIGTAADLLINAGRLYMVHQASRLVEILSLLQILGLEPKTLQSVHTTADVPPHLVLLEAVKGGKSGLSWREPLVIYRENGQYTEALERIYHRGVYAEN